MRKHRHLLIFSKISLLNLFLILCLSQRVIAEDGSIAGSLIGEWEGSGRLLGAEATFSMKWEWVLGQQFLQLTFQNKMLSSDGVESGLSAQAFYRPGEAGRFDGTWFDSRGMVLPLKGSADREALNIEWGTPETEQGRTVYRLLDQSRIEVKDFVLRGEEWHQFGQAIYMRARAIR